jgi:uncharacterized membrane protein YfcA
MLIFSWVSLIALAIWFSLVLIKDLLANRTKFENSSWLKTSLIGFAVNFFDVLVLLQAFIFITIIEVDPLTLISMLVSAAVGAVIGAGIVSKLSERKIRLTMGIALVITAGFMLARMMDWIQGGGDAIGLTGYKLAFAVVVNFFLGAIMTAGVGLYAPCMALIFALGMSPQVAFPIMMGSCAFLMPPASVKFIKTGSYNRKAALAMAIPGSIAVLIAAFIVKSLPLQTLQWVVLGVILYTSATMLVAAFKKKEA